MDHSAFSSEKSEKREFLIKRLQRVARAYDFLKLLLDAEEYSIIEFPTLLHTVGELEIKKELKKLFFPSNKFAAVQSSASVKSIIQLTLQWF
ncbi:hypothetical protein [Candidatus Protochlamydia sp. R18]|uniref:hypothetical protein n=1 Tax=Candidatus Protochlamydia sp. R18 TaxID=1353977 RepID=UPI001D03C61A|nr:hypothetical protein [Candidatus Protochlamydia sp. R18]